MNARCLLLGVAAIGLSAALAMTSLRAQAPARLERLSAAARAMDAHLKTFPEPNQSQWRSYFGWEDWGPGLVQGAAPVQGSLEGVTARFYGIYEGLDAPAFLRMRDEMKAFLSSSAPASSPGSYPSLRIRVQQAEIDKELAKLAVTRIDHKNTGNWIAGAWVTGLAQCQAAMSAQLGTYQGQAAVEVRVKGHIHSPHTIAQKGRFQIHGSANSQMEGVAYLYLDHTSIRTSEPQFTAQTQSQIDYVDGPRLLQGIALRQAHKKMGQGEQEGSQIIAAQAADELKRELAMELGKADAEIALYEKYQPLLHSADLFPTQIKTGLKESALEVGIQFPASGAISPPLPKPLAAESAFEISMHESLVAAFVANFLRGAWWADIDFSRIQKEITGSNSNELLIGALPERWSVRWEWSQPMVARIADDHIEYEMHFSQARIDDRLLNSGFTVNTRFFPTVTRWGIEFRRQGEVKVESSAADQQFSPEDLAFFKRIFSSLFGETVYLDGLSPPAGGGWDDLASYTIASAALEPGWFVLNCKKKEPQSKQPARPNPITD
jgi:hypothetical protein